MLQENAENLERQKKQKSPSASAQSGSTKHVWLFTAALVRAACLQNETAPEKLLNRYEKRSEKREKDPKNDPKRDRKISSPSQAA